MKRKIISLISLLVISAGVGANNLYVGSNVVEDTAKIKKSTNIVEKPKEKEEKVVQKAEEEEDTNEKSTEVVEESINESDTSSTGSSNNSNSSGSNNQATSRTQSNNSVVNNYNPPHVQTEWEKLGISEYDYYNTAPPNEGEIATGITDCIAKKDEINKKYSFVTHSGDVRSYSEKYLGCWITIHFNDGSKMFYNEFKAREDRGEFNYLLAP